VRQTQFWLVAFIGVDAITLLVVSLTINWNVFKVV